MPVKFSKSFKQMDKVTKRVTVVHDYIKNKSKENLLSLVGGFRKNLSLSAICDSGFSYLI